MMHLWWGRPRALTAADFDEALMALKAARAGDAARLAAAAYLMQQHVPIGLPNGRT